MVASIEFKSNQNTLISGLENVKIITLNDGVGNKYTLETAEDGLRLKYKPSNKKEVEYKVEGLAAALGSLFNVKSDSGEKTTVLQKKVAEKPIVEAILYAKDDDGKIISNNLLMHTFARKDDLSDHIKSQLRKKADKDELDKKADIGNVYTKKEINDKLEDKANTHDVYTKNEINDELRTKADTDNVYTREDADSKLVIKANAHEVYTKQEANEKFFPLADHRILAQEMLEKRIDGVPILIKTLAKFLDEEHVWYGNENDQTAKEFLAEKGEFTKTDGSNIRIPDFTNKILGATKDIEGGKKKSILIEQLGEFLDKINDNDRVYDSKIAKDFLGKKGMQGSRGADGAQGPAGRDGESPSASDVAQELITNKVTELGQAILNIKRGDEEQPALETDLANNSNFQEFVAGNQGLRDAVTTNLKSNGAFHGIAKRNLSEDGENLSVNDVVTLLLSDKNKTLINAIGNDKEVAARILGATDTYERKSILVEKLAKFLDEEHVWYGNENDQTAKEFLAEKGEFTKTDGSNIRIPDFTNKILGATKDIEGGKKKSILIEQLGEFLDKINDNDRVYDSKIAKDFLGKKGMQGSRGADGAQGPAGRDGESPSASDVAQELITNKVTELGQAILNIKRGDEEQPALETDLANNSNFQEFVAGNQGLRDAVTTNLKSNGAFHGIAKRNLSEDGENLSVNDVVTLLLSDKNKTLINAIGNDKEVAARILGATDTYERKSILVEKLAKFLDEEHVWYGNENDQTAKEFLNSKGLALSIDTSDPNFYGAIREIISRPYFEMPDDPNAPLSWDW